MSADDPKVRPGRRRLSDDERRLWRGITRAVAPLKQKPAPAERETAVAAEAEAKSAPPRHRRAESDARRPAAPPKPAPPLAPIDRRLRQRLARGSEAIDARIDLHGMTQSQAHAALLRFLRRAQADGDRFVLVITGKGGRRADELAGERGVLKRQAPLWLRQPEFRAFVVGFEDAHIAHGGEGALYVRVRRRKP